MPLPPLHKTDNVKIWGSPGVGQNKCVISAHGEAIVGATVALRPGVSVQFYVPAGQSIDLGGRNAGLLQIAAGQYQPPIPADVGSCPDYSLSKFEEYHEGYSGVPGHAYEVTVSRAKAFVKPNAERGTYGQVQSAVDAGVPMVAGGMARLVMDIVTIRFRPHRSDPTLGVVIRELVALGYKEIHCPFCRE